MPDLKQAINILVAVVLMLVIMLLGDYLGYKFGRMKLLASVGFIGLAVVIAYAIYSFVVLVLLA
ncbi:MAG: hypothetical protein Q7O66_14895 [Dehalococcoidia bacterium]|nr:hypothetical protein [Dehalococcoidia bacterium]